MQRLRENWDAIALTAPALHEVRFGVLRVPLSHRRRSIEAYLASVVSTQSSVHPYDLNAAERHASERARLVASGRTPPFVDSQIAAVAAVNDLVLVTFNTRDFQHFRGLRIEDWSV